MHLKTDIQWVQKTETTFICSGNKVITYKSWEQSMIKLHSQHKLTGKKYDSWKDLCWWLMTI